MRKDSVILELNSVRFDYIQRKSLFKSLRYPAVKDVTFTVDRGSTFGIIGRNGCGKSTLLKVVAGIYRPNAGEVRRYCKNVSLLSLALGFDPQLTGKENAILSGMLAGSSRQKVLGELDEILSFAELGAFVDEPVKTYSTGMRSRLAFSVAIRLKTDLLLLDEVLSVGDAQFRMKAEEAIISRIKSEQTVIMVSHSLAQIESLCDRAVWMHSGRVKEVGPAANVVQQYKRFIGAK